MNGHDEHASGYQAGDTDPTHLVQPGPQSSVANVSSPMGRRTGSWLPIRRLTLGRSRCRGVLNDWDETTVPAGTGVTRARNAVCW